MVFSEPAFLFIFLPLFLVVYFVCPGRWRNALLLIASLFFYAWGDERALPILLGSIVLNYVAGIAIERVRPRSAWPLYAGVTLNLLLLAYYKYFLFLIGNLGLSDYAGYAPALPIGISFFTFQGISYLVDISRGRVRAQRDPLLMALYISMFPQLIAGPIVRYSEVERELTGRRTTPDDFAEGVQRFLIGLAKKALIADPLARFADRIFMLPPEALSPATAWLGAVAFMLQIYYDFSAYSDMAIGMGRMLGFRFPENFRHPFTATSISEFWLRWHMTLSRWFRDYVLLPLVGRRPGRAWGNVSILIVFFLTGLWHGAAWTFAAWGSYNGALLVIERLGLRDILKRAPAAVGHVYLLLAVLFGAVLFRSADMTQAAGFYAAMLLGQTGELAPFHPPARYLDGHVVAVLAAGMLFSMPVRERAGALLAARLPAPAATLGRIGFSWFLLAASILSVGTASYTPFLYFRF